MLGKISNVAFATIVVWIATGLLLSLAMFWVGSPLSTKVAAAKAASSKAPAKKAKIEKKESQPAKKQASATKAKTIVAESETGSVEDETKSLRDFVADTRECFDGGDMECALQNAENGLKKYPKHIQLKRWAIAAACQTGEEDSAKTYFSDLPPAHQRAMKIKCRRFNITLE